MRDLEERLMSRRDLLSGMILGLLGLAGAVVSVPILAYLLSPLLRSAEQAWRDIGAVDDFEIGRTVLVTFGEPSPLPWAGQTANTAAWVRRTGQSSFTAFAVNCTHLGCPVNWQEDAELFLCPCHGGVYYLDGNVAGGPPPRRLWEHDLRIVDGRLQILTRPLQVA